MVQACVVYFYDRASEEITNHTTHTQITDHRWQERGAEEVNEVLEVSTFHMLGKGLGTSLRHNWQGGGGYND